MKKILWILGLAVFLGLVTWLILAPSKAGRLDTFATCIKDSGAKFYGAYWCPHCRNQKAIFGSSAKLLPYVECSTPNGQSQTPFCTSLGISSYPTWTFQTASGTATTTGEISLEDLSKRTSCELPQ